MAEHAMTEKMTATGCKPMRVPTSQGERT